MNYRAEQIVTSSILYGSVAAVLLFFYIPIFTTIAFSFHEGRYLTVPFDGYSLKWYSELFANPNVGASAINSAFVATVSAILCTTIGTGAALCLVRYRFRLKTVFQAISLFPLFFPQLLLGVILLLWFSVLGNWFNFSTGIPTIIIGHVVYITPFAMVIICVQVYNLDDTLEDAARDCGATTWEVYREVTLPLVWPGIFSAAIFSFLLSWGNFYITYSLGGTTRTLPTFVFSGIAMGSSPIYTALATVIFVPGLMLVFLAEWLRRRKYRNTTGVS